MHAPSPDFRERRFQVRHEGLDVLALGKLAALLVRIEVAIGALAQAPRDVHVERERRQLREADARTRCARVHAFGRRSAAAAPSRSRFASRTRSARRTSANSAGAIPWIAA